MNYFSPTLGLVTKCDDHSENAGLFFAHYLVLKDMLGLGFTQTDLELFRNKMFHAIVSNGLYLRSEYHTTRTVSHDEITGFMVASSLLDTFHASDVWQYLHDHNGNYPATGENKHYSPADYYAWAVINGESRFFNAILYTINLLISSNKSKQNTSSKLIYLTELYVMKSKSKYSLLLYKYFTLRMKVMYGKKWIKSLYDVYFHTEDMDHPLRDLSSRIDHNI